MLLSTLQVVESEEKEKDPPKNLFFWGLCPKLWVGGGSAQRVGFFNIGSGRVLDEIPGSRSGSGRGGVLKYSSGIFGYLFYSRVTPGIPSISG